MSSSGQALRPAAVDLGSTGGARGPLGNVGTDPQRPLGAAAATARRIALQYRGTEGPLLPILHALQHELGCIPPETAQILADTLNLSRAEVHGVITFYPHFRSTPAGRHVIELCRAEACQARGADALADHARRALGCDFHQTSADGAVTLEPVYCLGLCAQSPSALIDGQPHARLSPARFDRLLAALATAPAQASASVSASTSASA